MSRPTNKESFDKMKGDALHFMLVKAFRKAGATTDQIWALTEPENCTLLKRAIDGLGTRKPLPNEESAVIEASQPV